MDVIFFALALLSLILFVSWVNIVRVSGRSMKMIKSNDGDLYKKLLKGNSSSWLERGVYSPVDVGIQYRLYKTIYQRKPINLIGQDMCVQFIWSVRIFLVSACMFIFLFIVFLSQF